MNSKPDQTEDLTDARLDHLEELTWNLRRAVVAILSHTIRRHHLPSFFTPESELWDRLRDLDGNCACSAVSHEIEKVRAILRRGRDT